MNVFICCSASNEIDDSFKEEAKKVASLLAMRDCNLIFGASKNGLMGVIYNEFKKKGRIVRGALPKFYVDDSNGLNLDSLFVTDSMFESTSKMIELADFILVLPGGIGTFYEVLSTIQRKRCKEITIPLIIYNESGYYNKLEEMLNKSCLLKFSNNKDKDLYHFSNNIEDCMDYLTEIGIVK